MRLKRKFETFPTLQDGYAWYSKLPGWKRLFLDLYSYPYFPFTCSNENLINIGTIANGNR